MARGRVYSHKQENIHQRQGIRREKQGHERKEILASMGSSLNRQSGLATLQSSLNKSRFFTTSGPDRQSRMGGIWSRKPTDYSEED